MPGSRDLLRRPGAVELDELTHLAHVSVHPDTAPELYGAIDGALTRAGVRQRRRVPGDNVANVAHLIATGEAFGRVGLETGAPARRSTPHQS